MGIVLLAGAHGPTLSRAPAETSGKQTTVQSQLGGCCPYRLQRQVTHRRPLAFPSAPALSAPLPTQIFFLPPLMGRRKGQRRLKGMVRGEENGGRACMDRLSPSRLPAATATGVLGSSREVVSPSPPSVANGCLASYQDAACRSVALRGETTPAILSTPS